MTSAPNRPLPLSGNRKRLIFLFLISVLMQVSCGSARQPQRSEVAKPAPPVVKQETHNTAKEEKKEKKIEKKLRDHIADSLDKLYPTVRKDRYSVALFAPLYAGVAEPEKGQKTAISLSRDFYRGLRIAADTLSLCGLNLDLHIYDSEDAGLNARNVNDTLKRIDADLIMGPLLESKMRFMDSLAQLNRINCVSPLLNSDKQRNRTYSFESIPTSETLGIETAKAIKERYPHYNIILVNEKKTKGNATAAAFASAFRRDSITIIDFNGKISDKDLPEINLKDSNIVFIPSRNEAFVSTVLGMLRVHTEYTKVVGLLPWQFFKTIEGELWEKFNIHLACSYFLDYNDPNLSGFISSYRKRYNDEPSVWAFIGFDEMAYYGRMLGIYGRYFQKGMLGTSQPALHTIYRMRPTLNTGWKNMYVNIIQFQGYKLKRIER